jgi:hypothetical protein
MIEYKKIDLKEHGHFSLINIEILSKRSQYYFLILKFSVVVSIYLNL